MSKKKIVKKTAKKIVKKVAKKKTVTRTSNQVKKPIKKVIKKEPSKKTTFKSILKTAKLNRKQLPILPIMPDIPNIPEIFKVSKTLPKGVSPEDRNIIYGFYKIEAEVVVENKTVTRPGYVCIALKRPPKGSSSKRFVAAASFGSPYDSLNRKRARVIARGRLKSDRPGRHFVVLSAKAANAKGFALDKVFAAALDRSFSPKRVVPKGERQEKTTYAPNWVHEALAQNVAAERLFSSKENARK